MKIKKKFGALMLSSVLLLCTLFPTIASAATTTDSYTATVENVLGFTIVWHTQTFTFTYNGTTLSDPKAVSNKVSGSCTVSNKTSNWTYYNTSNGEAYSVASCLFGVPTPWGGIGYTAELSITTDVTRSGFYTSYFN